MIEKAVCHDSYALCLLDNLGKVIGRKKLRRIVRQYTHIFYTAVAVRLDYFSFNGVNYLFRKYLFKLDAKFIEAFFLIASFAVAPNRQKKLPLNLIRLYFEQF